MTQRLSGKLFLLSLSLVSCTTLSNTFTPAPYEVFINPVVVSMLPYTCSIAVPSVVTLKDSQSGSIIMTSDKNSLFVGQVDHNHILEGKLIESHCTYGVYWVRRL